MKARKGDPKATADQASAVPANDEQRYRGLFEHAPIALWQEDYSALREHFDRRMLEQTAVALLVVDRYGRLLVGRRLLIPVSSLHGLRVGTPGAFLRLYRVPEVSG